MSTDAECLSDIVACLDGVEWSADTLQDIAEILTRHGYRIRDLDDDDLTLLDDLPEPEDA